MVACTVFILLVYTSFLKISDAQNDDCEWNKDIHFPQFPPLILETSSKKIVLPKLEGLERIIRVASGTMLTMSCYGINPRTTKKNSFSNSKFPNNPQDVFVECVNGRLEYGNPIQVISMKDMGCESKIRGGARYTRGTCGSQGNLFEIGFNFKDSNSNADFYPQITVCFDTSDETPLWSEHTLYGRNINAKDPVPKPLDPNKPTKKRQRPDFSSDIAPYTPVIEIIYTIAAQTTHGSFTNLIQFSGGEYFARGHLAPAADFVKQPEMDATFQFINVVPQWQQINNGNWGNIEDNIRKLAASPPGTNMRIFTGGYGILKDSNGNNLYLADTDNFAFGQQKVPIPEATWKIVIDQTSKHGVAFFVSNDPFSTQNPASLNTNTCTNLKFTWLGKLDPVNKKRGHTDCFTIGNFKNKYPNIIKNLPGDIDFSAVLLN